MSPLERELEGGAPLRLLPHQTAFVESVLGATGQRVTLLRGDVGLGKSTTLVALASRLLHEQPTARCLFLVPAPLRLQFVEMLRRAGVAALLVDRYQFREMVDSAGGSELWPHGAVAVLGREFARQVDILESVASVQWDLVVADEAHAFGGSRAELLRRVGASAKRLVLASASVISLPDALSIEDAAVVQWRRDQLVDGNGEPLDVVPRPVLNEVGFDLNQVEQSLVDAVRAVCGILESGTPQQAALAKLLLRSLRSSPAPLEAMLQRLAATAGAVDDGGVALGAADEEEEAAGDGPTWSVDHLTAEKAGSAIGRALQEIGAIKVDSKVIAFGGLLAQLIEAKTPATRICVLTDFLATCFYLVAEIEGRGLTCQLLHGGMDSDDRLRSLTTFLGTGEILIATRAVMAEGLNLSHVTDLVLYDAPESKHALQQVLGRFDRFGRLSQLRVHVLVSRFGVDDTSSAPVQLLRELVADRTEP